jgi:hypothetical protein
MQLESANEKQPDARINAAAKIERSIQVLDEIRANSAPVE